MSGSDRASALHNELREARRVQRRADHRVAVLLAEMQQGKHHEALGYATVLDYARAQLELDRRRTIALLRVGRKLPQLPALDAALAEGRLDITKARELVRVVTPENEAAWIARCEPLTNREIERMVRAVPRGEPPPDEVPPASLGSSRRKVWFELESTDADLVFSAIRVVQEEARAAGEELDDGAALAVLARQQMASDESVTGVSYRIVVHAEPTGELRIGDDEVSDTMGALALCDAELVDMSDGKKRGHTRRTVPPATREAVMARDDGRCVVPHCRNRRWLQIHHLRAWAFGGTHREDNLAVVCNTHHRLIHEGRLALERLPDGRWRVEHLDERVEIGPPPRRPTGPTWVRPGPETPPIVQNT